MIINLRKNEKKVSTSRLGDCTKELDKEKEKGNKEDRKVKNFNDKARNNTGGRTKKPDVKKKNKAKVDTMSPNKRLKSSVNKPVERINLPPQSGVRNSPKKGSISYIFHTLFVKFSIIETKEVYESFDYFKENYLDKLEFINQQMLEVYQMAFFYKFYNLKISKVKYCGKIKVPVFNNALNEIEIQTPKKEQPTKYICNLFSILHPYTPPDL